MKNSKEGLRELNKLLKALPKYSSDISNNDVASHLGVEISWLYTGIKKLQALLRINEHDKRDVIDHTPVTMEEYNKVGDPYHKEDKRKKREKARLTGKKGTGEKKTANKTIISAYRKRVERVKDVAPLLNAPIDINTGGSEISISGSAEGVARFLKLLNDGILK